MALKISKHEAELVMREAAAASESQSKSIWAEKVERLSRLCADGKAMTHIAFLGTAMLAKATDRHADLFAIKPLHALENANAYSARSLCHTVLVPLAAELGISIGVTGREPLNNQPYFRMTRLDDGTPIRRGGQQAFAYMLGLINELQSMKDERQAFTALQAYIAVRKQHQPRYTVDQDGVAVSPEQLISAITSLVGQDSEGGRRAQAVVAGLLDTFAGPNRVESGRINDPSRKYPGDVCVRGAAEEYIWEKAIEVRDKPVTPVDVQIFAQKCIEMGVREAAVVMVSTAQPKLDNAKLQSWAGKFGIGLTLFYSWADLVDQALFWSEEPKPVAAAKSAAAIRRRLIGVEVSPAAVDFWDQAIRHG